MSGEFNIQIMLDNIYFLLEKSGKKIGELEGEAGVSAGYISRISKDGNTKPGIEFIMKVADSFNVCLDTLLKVELAKMTPTERYLAFFFEKLIKDTLEDKLDWDKESADQLNRLESDINGYSDHPLFNYETFFEEDENGFPLEVSRVVFNSHSFGCNTYINGDCFNLSLKSGSKLYLMNISESVRRLDDPDAFAKEIWLWVQGAAGKFLCSDKDASQLANLVDNLFATVSEKMKYPRIEREFKYVIDAFMQDDVSDDEIPF